jgi:hypothetical protein
LAGNLARTIDWHWPAGFLHDLSCHVSGHFRRPLMVLKNVFVAAVCVALLALAGPAAADEYRPSEFLNLDLSRAVLSPKRLGPETEFAPVSVEAKTDGAQAEAVASVRPKPPVRKIHVAKTHVEKTRAESPHAVAHVNARAKLARRHGNPLDAQAADRQIQTWPCRSGGICNWQR